MNRPPAAALRIAPILALVAAAAGCAGKDGSACTVRDNGDGTATVSCDDGTSVVITGGTDGGSCTVTDNGDGTRTILCDDGTTVTVSDGGIAPPGARIRTSDLHGETVADVDALAGRVPVTVTVSGAVVAADGTLAVAFAVARPSGAPVLDLTGAAVSVARLLATPGEPSPTRWVPYVQRLTTVVGDAFPNPAGTAAWQGWRDEAGTLQGHGDGTYTYTLLTNLSTASGAEGSPIGLDRDATHRVLVVPGLPYVAIADGRLDFVPAGGAPAVTREVIRTASCQGCHGAGFAAHEGTVRSVEGCATCHTAGSADPHGGASLELGVMLHKVHAGGELPTVAGPDGTAWLTADNGSYAIWDQSGTKHEWWNVSLPADLASCRACHRPGALEADAWKERPSRAACGACHDDVDFASPTTTHQGGIQVTDASCTVCHPSEEGMYPVAGEHDRFGTDTGAPLYDDRNVPEFTFAVALTAPANGTDYRGDEAPVLTIVIHRGGVPLADHRIQSGSAQGCKHAIDPVLCDPDADGRFANAALFVHGPRAARRPVLTTAARAQILSTTTGPFDLSAAGAALSLALDQGADVFLSDAWGTRLAGTVTVPVSSGAWATGPAAATTDEIVAWLNGNAPFAARAIAWNEAGRVGLRSRNLGPVAGLQLLAGAVTTAVFGGDTSARMPTGSTTSNQLTSLTDPKISRFADRIEVQLDPVTDLRPGTYVVGLEIAQLGRVSATDYKAPSVIKVPFQVKRATPEPLVADGCAACHQDGTGRGLVLDYARHYKVLDDTATDQCGACHDLQPQVATDTAGLGRWTGARPLARRVHAIHAGASLLYPLRTVDYAIGDPEAGRDWRIAYPADLRRCAPCHSEATSGSWRTRPGRSACSGCHDADAAAVHMRLMTEDPTPADPWSGDEQESCAACH